MKPFYKWSGGKSRELSRIKNFLPQKYNTYYEPFLGGGATWLGLEPEVSIVGDSYPDIINFFEVLKSKRKSLINHLNDLSSKYNEKVSKCNTKEEQQTVAEEFYYYYRDNDFKSKFDKAVKFYMLRQLSFSGMLRFSKEGRFNVPYGWYKTLKSLSYDDKELAKILKNTTFINGDWKDTLKDASLSDFVFFDPPYTRKFQKYHPDGSFGRKEHEELAEWFDSKKAMSMIIINKDEFTYGLYKKYIKDEYGKKYSIQYRDRMKEGDSNAIHILACNYDVV